jgi:hypothetical protein
MLAGSRHEREVLINHATLDDLEAVYRVFQSFPELRHVRRSGRYDSLDKRIESGHCVWERGVIITYQVYTRRVPLGTCVVPKGATMIHQIASVEHNGAKVFAEFAAGKDVWLTVRKDNARACRFYERMGMKIIGTIEWSKGTVPGLIYRRFA